MRSRSGGRVLDGPVAGEVCSENGDIVGLGEFEGGSEADYARAGGCQ